MNLGLVRDLMAEFEKVATAIRRGRTTAFNITLRDEDGEETVYLGGLYKRDARAALRSHLKVSAARTLIEDPPLKIKKR